MIKIVPILAIALILIAAKMNKQPKGIDISAMDKNVKPGNDFFQYANGTWLKNNEIPASESRWGSFNVVSERNNDILKQILEDAGANIDKDPQSARAKVGTFYRMYMDTALREKQGVAPVLPDLLAIQKISNTDELITLIAQMFRKGIRPAFGFHISQDLKNSTVYIPYLSQGGLGLPDRDYYLKDDAKSKKIREEYANHINSLGKIFGTFKSDEQNSIINIETEFAKASMSRVERRNAEKQYNKRSFSQIVKDYPNLKFELFCRTIGVRSFDSIIVSQPLFFETLNNMLQTVSLEQWKNYLSWNLMNSSAGFLDSRAEQQNFYFYNTVLSGVKEQKPRWKRAINAANGTVGELLGQLFVERAFSPESKKRVNEMVDNIIASFRNRLNNLDWMTKETKIKAIAKLESFNRKLAYPDKWRDLSKLEIKEDSYIANNYRASEFNFNEMIDKLGKPIDRERWGMTPQTVNAYYSATMNEIVFPAAIMQPPFFDADADEAVNYGSIGAVIGHELVHGFDDQGSKYGPDGNLKSWWTDEDRKLFEAKTKLLVEQYNSYKVLDSLTINGELTLGENIADFGGLTIAYDAFKIYLKSHPTKNIDGFTPEQRFFLGFAQVWKSKSRPESVRQLILTDPHSPGEFRVIGTLTNMPQFYQAFNVKKGDKMWRSEQDLIRIW